MDLTQIKYLVVAMLSAFSVVLKMPDTVQNSVLSESTEVSQSPTVTPIESESNATSKITNQAKPGLFEEVNITRNSNHLASLELRNDLCQIANQRLNEQITNGKLDGHIGFKNIKVNHPNLATIFDKYSLVAEFLAYGGRSSKETVTLWNNSSNHKKLLNDGTFRYGCVVSKSLFAVAIAAY